jgi:threonine dehydratase
MGHPGRIDRPDIEQAAKRIAPWVRRTPIAELEPGAFGVDAQLTLKLELLQHTGSFKARGAFNTLLALPVPPAGVIAASGGNHGAAVAYAASRLGHAAEIFVPDSTSALKLERIRSAGAAVRFVPGFYPEALEASIARAEDTGALMVHAYDLPEIVAGQGTLGPEIERQAALDTLLVTVGGAGLIGGIAAWFQGGIRVVSVEPELAPTLARALEAGEPVDVTVGGIAADATGARRVGAVPFEILRRYVDTALLVSDEAIISARRLMWETTRIAAELGGAVGLAALLSRAYVPEPGERVGVVICGGNEDPSDLSSSRDVPTERGQAQSRDLG